MPTYGRSFTLVNETQFDIGAAASGGGAVGKFTNEAGFLAYYEVCTFLAQTNTTLVWDSEQQVPFAYRKDQWVGFDDERSLKTKVSCELTSLQVVEIQQSNNLSDGLDERKRLRRCDGLVS